jgi:hypothetical protein
MIFTSLNGHLQPFAFDDYVSFGVYSNGSLILEFWRGEDWTKSGFRKMEFAGVFIFNNSKKHYFSSIAEDLAAKKGMIVLKNLIIV